MSEHRTRRERAEARAAKRREWAESRKQKEAAAWDAHHAVPLPVGGEPIKAGHHSEARHRGAIARSHRLAFKALEHAGKAQDHEAKADGIEAQLANTIFTDDPDAIPALEARIAGREAERDRVKRYNASCRKGSPDESLLDDAQRADLAIMRQTAPYQLRNKGQFPPYVLANLSKNIKADRDRIKKVEYLAALAKRAEDAGGVCVIPRGASVMVAFASKPARPVIDDLKAAGFRWSNGAWHGPADSIPGSVQTQ
jgi:hypothetical protein